MAACSSRPPWGCIPVGPEAVDTFDSSAHAPVRPTIALPHILRCPRTSGCPLLPHRRWPCSKSRHGSECPCGTPCRTEHRNDSRAIPSLLRATPSATSEHFPELLGSPPISLSRVACCVCFQLRPLPSTGVTRLHRYCEPLRHPKQPGLSLARRQLTHTSITVGASRVASALLCMHAVVITPAGSAEAVRSYPSLDIGLPHVFAGSAPASNGFVACSTFTRVTTCMLTESPSDPLHQRLQQLRYLHYCFDCYRMERTRFRTGLIPLKNSAFHGARKPSVL